MADDKSTGQGAPATDVEGGQGDPAPAADDRPGADTPAAGGDDKGQPDLEAQLDEQRRIQAGLDKRIAQLTQQLAVYEQEKEDARKEAAEARQQLEALQGQAGEGSEEMAELQRRVEALQGDKADLETRLQATQAEVEKAKIIAAEFPALAPLMAEGALPQAGDIEEFREAAQRVAKALNAQTAVALQEKMRGTKPPASPPAGKQAGDLDALHQDMMVALRANDMDRYNELREQWYAAAEALK